MAGKQWAQPIVTGSTVMFEPLRDWVREVAAWTRPSAIVFCDGSDEERRRLISRVVLQGTLVPLNPAIRPNSYLCRTDPTDVARVEDRTFICSPDEDDAGPTNNWVAPDEMKKTMWGLYEGSMWGRTMYVLPFCMGSLDADDPKFGVEITDSTYVAISMTIMTTTGDAVVREMVRRSQLPERPVSFVKCLHSRGVPIEPGTKDAPWPHNATKYISHFPATREIWSYGSGYGGNALLGKKCFALRIASVMARDEGWLAEHMLILRLTSPAGRVYHICAAFPSACGKTNLAMITPTLPGWRAETIGDDIAWLRPGPDGRLWAVNPEQGFFGVAPGTSDATNPVAMRTVERDTIFTNVALTDDGDVWWEGMTPTPPEHLTDWHGKDWTPNSGSKAAHPNSRFTTPLRCCPTVPADVPPNGVPVDAIIFGGRRATTIPLVVQARDWLQGVFLGSTCSSATTAATIGTVGVVRRDPMAMLPFIGYHACDYLRHWLDMGSASAPDALPKIFYVNWFRENGQGNFLWPGFGDNVRVLKWIIQRLEGELPAVESPIGWLPRVEDLDVDGLDMTPNDLDELTRFDAAAWAGEVPSIEQWYQSLSSDGKSVPTELMGELDLLAGAV
ncbi:MAG: phosphoenolpyruvate carboxykinase (GTP) [Propionibacteriaceae bacterium]|nr:phosphoenolpyruvate carboxykinase (GTP) [Propionibacteriaceae bacterium]